VRLREIWRVGLAILFACGVCFAAQTGRTGVTYHLEPSKPLCRFDDSQTSLLEKLNRAHRGYLVRLKHVILPSQWDRDELAYSRCHTRCHDLLLRQKLWLSISARSYLAHTHSGIWFDGDQ
jgi:hypothetical protein